MTAAERRGPALAAFGLHPTMRQRNEIYLTEEREMSKAWMKTSISLICATCRKTCLVEQEDWPGPRLRIEHHPDIRDAIAIPQPPCPGGGQEQVLVATAKLDQARKNYVLTEDPRMVGYYEGWREAARELDPRPVPPPRQECLGHPSGSIGPGGQTVYCDGSCRGRGR